MLHTLSAQHSNVSFFEVFFDVYCRTTDERALFFECWCQFLQSLSPSLQPYSQNRQAFGRKPSMRRPRRRPYPPSSSSSWSELGRAWQLFDRICCYSLVFFVSWSPCSAQTRKRSSTARAPIANERPSNRLKTVEGIIGQKVRDNVPNMSQSGTDSVMGNDDRTPRERMPFDFVMGTLMNWNRISYDSLRCVRQERKGHAHCAGGAEELPRRGWQNLGEKQLVGHENPTSLALKTSLSVTHPSRTRRRSAASSVGRCISGRDILGWKTLHL